MDARWILPSPNQQNGYDRKLMILVEDCFGVLEKMVAIFTYSVILYWINLCPSNASSIDDTLLLAASLYMGKVLNRLGLPTSLN